ncbi:MAG: hypothetical protein J6J31_00905, partial [Thermoguttaceae bacterium]|nr:hypothetical protein [Thermoguttaceae bacterium]
MYRKVILGLSMLVSFLTALPSFAQTGDSLAIYQTFGKGVHYYNAQDYAAAYEKFTDCINSGTQNPSIFYFRGLALLNLGRAEAAEMDFKSGAEFEEKANMDTQKQIGYDLQFVQGNVRQTLEKYRAEAKLAAYQRVREIRAMQENINAHNALKNKDLHTFDSTYSYDTGLGESEAYEEYTSLDEEENADLNAEEAVEEDEEEEAADEDEDLMDEEEEEEETAEEDISSEDAAEDFNLDDEIGPTSIGDDDDDDAAADDEDSTFGDDDDDDAAADDEDSTFGDDDDDDAAADDEDSAFGDDDDDDAAADDEDAALGDDDDDDAAADD